MAKSYGDDLRRKLLEAHDRGEGTLDQLATRLSVSLPWAWKISAQRKHSGQMERIEQRRGSRRKVTPEVEQRLGGWIEAQPDLTLAELQQKLEQAVHLHVSVAGLSLPPSVGVLTQQLEPAVHLHVSVGRLWQVLRQMGLRLKKSRFTPSNATAKRTASGGKSSSSASRPSRRRS